MCIIEIDKSPRLNETAPSALARWYSDGKYTDLMTGSAPTSFDSSAACFGIVEGSADLDFGKYGSVRTGDLSILAADTNTAGTIQGDLRLPPLTMMSPSEREYWLDGPWAGM